MKKRIIALWQEDDSFQIENWKAGPRSEGGLITYIFFFLFDLVPFSKKMNEIITLNFFTLGWKVEDSNFVHFFENVTKLEIASEIRPPLEAVNWMWSSNLLFLMGTNTFGISQTALHYGKWLAMLHYLIPIVFSENAARF